MTKSRPLQEPIRLQDLLNSARSKAEKKVKNLSEEHWKLYFTIQRKNQVFVYHVLELLLSRNPSPNVFASHFPTFQLPACRRPRVPASLCLRVSRLGVPESHVPASSSPTSPGPRVPALSEYCATVKQLKTYAHCNDWNCIPKTFSGYFLSYCSLPRWVHQTTMI